MTSQIGAHLAVVVLTLATVVVVVGLHYEGLNWLARWLARSKGPHRPRVLRAVIGLMALHVAEIWIFGGTYWLALTMPGAGSIGGVPSVGILDAVYLSAMSFSTVGFGDVVPLGAIRFIAGSEAVLGLFLIAWSATFAYLEMEQNWTERTRREPRRPGPQAPTGLAGRNAAADRSTRDRLSLEGE